MNGAHPDLSRREFLAAGAGATAIASRPISPPPRRVSHWTGPTGRDRFGARHVAKEGPGRHDEIHDITRLLTVAERLR